MCRVLLRLKTCALAQMPILNNAGKRQVAVDCIFALANMSDWVSLGLNGGAR